MKRAVILLLVMSMVMLVGCMNQEEESAKWIRVDEYQGDAIIDEVNTEHFYYLSFDGADYIRYRYEYRKPGEDENVYVVASNTNVDEMVLAQSIEAETGWNIGLLQVKQTQEGLKAYLSDASDVYRADGAGKGDYYIEEQKVLVKAILGCLKRTIQNEAIQRGEEKELPVYFLNEDGDPLSIEALPELNNSRPYMMDW